MEQYWHRQLRREASAHGMCAENRDALERVSGKEEAIELYKRTIDWALEEGYPSLHTIREFFSDCEEQGIYVDKVFHGEDLRDHQVYVFHNCTGTIRVGLNADKAIIPMLYFANGCTMKVEAAGPKGYATIVPLYVFGDNRITGEKSEDIVCKTFKLEVK